MKRQPKPEDITWFLDLEKKGQLNLNPPYQRKSVWTRKDRQFFLDTIFHNYPCPSIFLYRSITDQGAVKYHVVDGKQRLETILKFAADEIALSKDFGDARFDGKKFSELDIEAKREFWDYVITVEVLPSVEASLVNDVFDRINRNSRKLARQELRHAKFDGWLVKRAEAEVEKQEWSDLGIVTTARAKRMSDVQFISEIVMLTIQKEIAGFDQDSIDNFYADYDAPSEADPQFDVEQFEAAFNEAKQFIRQMTESDPGVAKYLRTLAHFYSLWAYIMLAKPKKIKPAQLAGKYVKFLDKVTALLSINEDGAKKKTDPVVARYAKNLRGANTDAAPRVERHKALVAAFKLKP